MFNLLGFVFVSFTLLMFTLLLADLAPGKALVTSQNLYYAAMNMLVTKGTILELLTTPLQS